MDAQLFLGQLRTQLARAPSIDEISSTPAVHMEWLGRTHALLARWDHFEAMAFRIAADSLSTGPHYIQQHIGTIFGALHRAIAATELQIPAGAQQVFGPGASYDFFRALTQVVNSAARSLFIADPYLDDSVLDFLPTIPPNVSVRLLSGGRYIDRLQPAAERFVAQYKRPLEIRVSPEFHDRIIGVDAADCWVLGMSIRKAAETKPTYLAPLGPDIAELKFPYYEAIWAGAVEATPPSR